MSHEKQYIIDLGFCINVVSIDTDRNWDNCSFTAKLIIPSYPTSSVKFIGDLVFASPPDGGEAPKLKLIKELDLMGNGAYSKLQNCGYGSAIVSSTLIQLKEHFSRTQADEVKISGTLSTVDDPNESEADYSPDFVARRRYFWEKMGFELQDSSDPLSKIQTTLDKVPTSIAPISVTKAATHIQTDAQAIAELKWTDYDEDVLNTMRKYAVVPQAESIAKLEQAIGKRKRMHEQIGSGLRYLTLLVAAFLGVRMGGAGLGGIMLGTLLSSIFYIFTPYWYNRCWTASKRYKADRDELYEKEQDARKTRIEIATNIIELDESRFGVLARGVKQGIVHEAGQSLIDLGHLSYSVKADLTEFKLLVSVLASPS